MAWQCEWCCGLCSIAQIPSQSCTAPWNSCSHCMLGVWFSLVLLLYGTVSSLMVGTSLSSLVTSILYMAYGTWWAINYSPDVFVWPGRLLFQNFTYWCLITSRGIAGWGGGRTIAPPTPNPMHSLTLVTYPLVRQIGKVVKRWHFRNLNVLLPWWQMLTMMTLCWVLCEHNPL